MRIFVTGTRGVPNIPGGVEKHCQELYPLIVKSGHEVILATRTPYVYQKEPSWQGVKLCHIFAPRQKNIEAIIHTFLAVLKARLLNVDLIHIHTVGLGLMVPLAKMLGLRVVVTNHGPDYDREKWGRVAKAMLRMGEYLGGKYANEVIVISSVIADIIEKRCGRKSNLIYNGVPLPAAREDTTFLSRLSVKPRNYILAVARFVPEKGLHDLIAAFSELDGDYQLVIAGDADHETPYSASLKDMAAKDDRIILTGYITGTPLQQIFANARLFVLPSSHEGLPIALLEAMSYELPVLVSDIPANKEVNLGKHSYFPCGQRAALKRQIKVLLEMGLPDEERTRYHQMLTGMYNWQNIATQTVAVYEKALSG